MQALGLSMWKLHHVRSEKAEVERLAQERLREDRMEAYHNKLPRSNSSSRDGNSSEITEDSSAGSHVGHATVNVHPEGGSRKLPDIDEEGVPVTKGYCPKISWIWAVGFLIFAVGNGGDFVALGITKQSVVTLVGSWALVVNTFTARCLLREIVHPLDVFASFLIIGGIVLTVTFSGKDSPEWPIERIVKQ